MATATTNTIWINRAPVLTLWAAVVAQRLGFKRAEVLSLGRALAGLNAQSKGRRLGLFQPSEQKPAKARQKEPEEKFLVELLGRAVPVVNTADGIRAVTGGKSVGPAGVEHYLEGKFGGDLGRVRRAMQQLAKAYPPALLARAAYALYEQFRPAIPAGKRGWGAAGELDLGRLTSLARAKR